jgi:tetratricopeptide (TPR) repeat protein
MPKRVIILLSFLSLTANLFAGIGRAEAAAPLVRLVKKIQPAVATVIVYDMERNIKNIGTGFFINRQGHLITNFHVVAGTYAADVRTSAGKSYPVRSVLSENRTADLLKLQVDIPAEEVSWIPLGDRQPEVAERVVVVGSPMGLEQTVSEGIVSSVREMPPVGTVFQISAPISPGSSGSPVVDFKGQVVGIATFQFLQGQNLNFAVGARQIQALKKFDSAKSVSEWTFGHMGNNPRMAQALCEKGFGLSISGEDGRAVEYFKKATENDPTDSEAWSGLGSCYVGLNHPEEAISAFKHAIQANPRDETSYFHLANYYHKLSRYAEAITAYREAIAINPQFEAAYFNLGVALVRLGRYDEGREAFESVVRLNPGAMPAHYHAGLAYRQLGKFEEAVRAQKNAIRLNPEFAPAYFAKGEAHGKLGQKKEEIEAYKEAIRVDPDFAPAHQAMGAALLKKGKKADAFEEYKILKRLDQELAQDLFKQIYSDDEPAKKPERNPQ